MDSDLLYDQLAVLGTAGIYNPGANSLANTADDVVGPVLLGGINITGANAPPNPAKNVATNWWAAHGGEVKLFAGLGLFLLVLGVGLVYLGPSLVVLAKG